MSACTKNVTEREQQRQRCRLTEWRATACTWHDLTAKGKKKYASTSIGMFFIHLGNFFGADSMNWGRQLGYPLSFHLLESNSTASMGHFHSDLHYWYHGCCSKWQAYRRLRNSFFFWMWVWTLAPREYQQTQRSWRWVDNSLLKSKLNRRKNVN